MAEEAWRQEKEYGVSYRQRKLTMVGARKHSRGVRGIPLRTDPKSVEHVCIKQRRLKGHGRNSPEHWYRLERLACPQCVGVGAHSDSPDSLRIDAMYF